MNDITRFIHSEGLNPIPERFLGSDILLGQRIETSHFHLVYRQEGERLILCDFAAREHDGQAVLALRKLLHHMIASVPRLRYLDALILPAPRDAQLHETRQRLRKLMQDEGAQQVQLDGELWLRYSCH